MSIPPAANAKSDLSERLSFSRWRALLREQYGLESTLPENSQFLSSIRIQSMTDLHVARVGMSAQVLTPRRSVPSTAPALYVKLVANGGMTLERRGFRQRFEAGSIAVVDPASQFTEAIDDHSRLVVIACSRTALQQRGIRCQLDGWSAPALSSPDTQLMKIMIQTAGTYSYSLRQHTRARMANQLLDLMDLLIGEENRSARSRSTDAVRFRIDRFLSQHLGDVGLSGEAIASGLKLSVNYINRMLSADNTSLMRYLWSLRLERAHEMLSSSEFQHLSIGELAWRCGFSAPAHFSRAFQQRYGLTPSAQRRLSCPHQRDKATIS